MDAKGCGQEFAAGDEITGLAFVSPDTGLLEVLGESKEGPVIREDAGISPASGEVEFRRRFRESSDAGESGIQEEDMRAFVLADLFEDSAIGGWDKTRSPQSLDVEGVFQLFEKNGEGESLLCQPGLGRNGGTDDGATGADEGSSSGEGDFAPVACDLTKEIAAGGGCARVRTEVFS